jgi:ketosteroid isomerase-like protein
MDDAVTRYCAASTSGDIDALMATLAPDIELVSPLSGRMVFRGRDDLRVLLEGVYGSLTDLHWGEPIGQGATRLAVSEGKVSGLRLDDAMMFELADDGQIRRIRAHLRPWLATTIFALKLGPKIARTPGVIWRALRSG